VSVQTPLPPSHPPTLPWRPAPPFTLTLSPCSQCPYLHPLTDTALPFVTLTTPYFSPPCALSLLAFLQPSPSPGQALHMMKAFLHGRRMSRSEREDAEEGRGGGGGALDVVPQIVLITDGSVPDERRICQHAQALLLDWGRSPPASSPLASVQPLPPPCAHRAMLLTELYCGLEEFAAWPVSGVWWCLLWLCNVCYGRVVPPMLMWCLQWRCGACYGDVVQALSATSISSSGSRPSAGAPRRWHTTWVSAAAPLARPLGSVPAAHKHMQGARFGRLPLTQTLSANPMRDTQYTGLAWRCARARHESATARE